MLTLGETDYSDKTWQGLDFQDGPLKNHVFSNCTFVKCKVNGVDFTGSKFSDCVFEHCELNLPKFINAGMRSVVFKGSKLIGVDFTKCDANFLDLAFEDCLIDTCNFSTLKLKLTPFLRCVIRETRFIETNLEGALFDHCDLEDSVFHQCNLTKASFRYAKNYFMDPTANKIKGAKFSLPEAVSLLKGLGIDID